MIKKFLLLSLISSSLFGMEITIISQTKNNDEKEHTFTATDSSTIKDLKRLVFQKANIPVSKQSIHAILERNAVGFKGSGPIRNGALIKNVLAKYPQTTYFLSVQKHNTCTCL